MKRKPWIIILIAFAHILAPLGNLALNALWSGRTFDTYIRLFFQPHNFLHNGANLLIPILAGCALLLCRSWSLIAYFVLMTALIFLDIRGFLERPLEVPPIALALVLAANIALMAYFALPAVRRAFTGRRLTASRYHFFVPARVELPAGGVEAVQAAIRNISETGLLIRTEATLPRNEKLGLKFQLESKDFYFVGHVVREEKTETSDTDFGIEFDHTTESQLQVRDVTGLLKNQGRLQAFREEEAEEAFLPWLRKVVTTGKGLIP